MIKHEIEIVSSVNLAKVDIILQKFYVRKKKMHIIFSP